MISAKRAFKNTNKEGTSYNSKWYNLWQINKMIKAAMNIGNNRIVLTWIDNDIMNALYDKGYKIFKVKANSKDNAISSLPLYIVQWDSDNFHYAYEAYKTAIDSMRD